MTKECNERLLELERFNNEITADCQFCDNAIWCEGYVSKCYILSLDKIPKYGDRCEKLIRYCYGGVEK